MALRASIGASCSIGYAVSATQYRRFAQYGFSILNSKILN